MWSKYSNYYNTDIICSEQEDMYSTSSSYYRQSSCRSSFDGIHTWLKYQGFTECYYYCSHCDTKKSLEEYENEKEQSIIPY
jgi:hypothetical protein